MKGFVSYFTRAAHDQFREVKSDDLYDYIDNYSHRVLISINIIDSFEKLLAICRYVETLY